MTRLLLCLRRLSNPNSLPGINLRNSWEMWLERTSTQVCASSHHHLPRDQGTRGRVFLVPFPHGVATEWGTDSGSAPLILPHRHTMSVGSFQIWMLVSTPGCGVAARLSQMWGKRRTIRLDRINCSGGEQGLNVVLPNPLKGPHRLKARLGTGGQQMSSLADRDIK